jgi:hypothetical protein
VSYFAARLVVFLSGLDVHRDFDPPLKLKLPPGKSDTYLKKWVNSRAEIVADKASYFGVAEGVDE